MIACKDIYSSIKVEEGFFEPKIEVKGKTKDFDSEKFIIKGIPISEEESKTKEFEDNTITGKIKRVISFSIDKYR